MSAEHLQPKPEIIVVGQEFQPFNPARTVPTISRRGEVGVPFILVTERIPIFEVNMNTGLMEERVLRTEAFTPFHPGEGYIVTDDDYSAALRARKIQRLEIAGVPSIDYRKASLDLWISITPEELKQCRFIEPDGVTLRPDVEEVLRALRLQLFFPSGAYEAQSESENFDAPDPFIMRIMGERSQVEQVAFDYFYPLDRGPLVPVELGNIDLDQPGLRILVGSEIEQLSQLRGKFILAA